MMSQSPRLSGAENYLALMRDPAHERRCHVPVYSTTGHSTQADWHLLHCERRLADQTILIEELKDPTEPRNATIFRDRRSPSEDELLRTTFEGSEWPTYVVQSLAALGV